MTNTQQAIVILTNLPSQSDAQHMAQTLVERGLAACVNVLSPCHSKYRWQGKIEQATEVPLLIKTTKAQYPQVEAAILAEHAYELPEIIALNVDGGYAPYLQWLAPQNLV